MQQLTRSSALDYIKNHTEQIASMILKPDKSGKGYICPICGAGQGERGTGLEYKNNRFFCWKSCYNGKSADILEMIKAVYGLQSFKETMNRAAELLDIELINDRVPLSVKSVKQEKSKSQAAIRPQAEKTEPKERKKSYDYSKSYEIWHSYISNTDYWKRRGFTRETVDKYKVGYWQGVDVNGEKWNALVIPIGKYGFLLRNTDQNASKAGDKHRRSRERGTPELFYNPLGITDFGANNKPVFIVEGEFDALSIIQSGGLAIAIRGAGKARIFVDWLLQHEPSNYVMLYIWLDDDEAGRAAAETIRAGLSDSFFVSFVLKSGERDVNDVLMSEPHELVTLIDILNRNYARDMKILLNETKGKKEYEQNIK